METIKEMEAVYDKMLSVEAEKSKILDNLKEMCTNVANENTKLQEQIRLEKAKCTGKDVEIKNLVSALGQSLMTNGELKKNLETANKQVQVANEKIDMLESKLVAERESSDDKIKKLNEKVASATLLLKSLDAVVKLRGTMNDDLTIRVGKHDDLVDDPIQIVSITSDSEPIKEENQQQNKNKVQGVKRHVETNVKQAQNPKKMTLRSQRQGEVFILPKPP